MANRWRHCADLTGPGIKPLTSRTDSVRFATELTAGSLTFSLIFLNHKLSQNKTYNISESNRKLISDRLSRSLKIKSQLPVAHIIANVYGIFVYTVGVGHSESIR